MKNKYQTAPKLLSFGTSIHPLILIAIFVIAKCKCCTSTGFNECNGLEGNETFVIIPSDTRKKFSLNASKISFQPHHYHNGNHKKRMIKQLSPEAILDGFLAKVEGAASNFRILVHSNHDGGGYDNDNASLNKNSDHQCSLQKTSSLAKAENCEYAVNGGPFQSYLTGGCVGLVISNGKVIHNPLDREFNVNNSQSLNDLIGDTNSDVGFGVTDQNDWILGDIIIPSNVTDVGNTKAHANTVNSNIDRSRNHVTISNNSCNNQKVEVKEFVSGIFGWLIKDNKIIPPKDDNDYAPRTAVGVNAVEGNLIIFQVDGCEKCHYKDKQRRGVTLYQMAEIMMSSPQINVTHAINLDGGGSSTSVMGGKVLNHPTCIDYFNWKCERPVGSIVCIKGDNLDGFQLSSTQSTKG